ncbi:DUF6751 family protein [Anaerovorax odorimutans]|uniref:DUF6751 family protein n=1 Tax=Anaerovorax odorimutans TaxID=109327 RepID=UPI00041EAA1A|nr:DUF6751 family protein [Anaerovorax odorimutans]
MFPHTVTIYNKDSSGQYHRKVISGVFWDSSKGAVMRKTGSTAADGLTLIIPFTADKTYLKSKEWLALTDKSTNWTLQPKDIVILGAIDYEVIKSSKELLQFDDVLTINNIDTRNFGTDMDHWEVSGK